jgi:HAMP domain-containing protein
MPASLDRRLVFALVALLLTSGCSLALRSRPAHVIAPLGVQILATVEQTQETIIRLTDAGTIPVEEGRKAVRGTVAILHAGKRLAAALRVLDSAQSALEKARASGEVTAVLDVINGLIFDVLGSFSGGSVQAQIGALLKEINALVIQIAAVAVRPT